MIYPKRCALCGEICESNKQLVCKKCASKPIVIQEPRCKKCSKPISSEELEYCYDCSNKEFHYKSGISLWLYDEVMKQSIIRFKYKGCKEYVNFYVSEVIKYLGDEIKRISPNVLLPVPVHKMRQRERGYNQAELIAAELGHQLHIPVRSNILQRIVKTTPQKELNSSERIKNLEKAFVVSKKGEKVLCSISRVMLVDDIYTTGSTIEACTKVLQKAGVKEVYFATLCIGEGY